MTRQGFAPQDDSLGAKGFATQDDPRGRIKPRLRQFALPQGE